MRHDLDGGLTTWQSRSAEREAVVRRRWQIALPVIAVVVSAGMAAAFLLRR